MKALRTSRDSAESLRRLVDVLDVLVDDHVGIVKHVRELRRDAGGPDFFHFSAEACNTGAFSASDNFRNGGGASTDRGLALAKAVGEAVERYCAALYDAEEFPFCSAASAPFPHVDPRDFALYAPGQHADPDFPWVPFDEKVKVRWTPALDLVSGRILHVPAAFVWIPYQYYLESGEAPIGQPISTGLACHCSPEEAALAGLGEVVERDAVMIMWQARMGMPQIEIDSLDDELRDLVARFERTGDTVTLFNITLDAGIPTIMAVLRSASTERPALVFAAAANLDPRVATRKALEELVHTWRYTNQLHRYSRPMSASDEYAAFSDQRDHLLFYCNHDNAWCADFVFGSPERQHFSSIENLSTGDHRRDLAQFVARLTNTGHRPLLADVTSDDVRGLGLHVMRALVPGYHPLFMGYRHRALGGKRLWEIPPTLGYPTIAGGADNPFPHPYP